MNNFRKGNVTLISWSKVELSVEESDMSTDTEDESNLDVISGIRGYEVTAIVACILIISAIFMCCLTWKFRYKIVLRTVRYNSP